jgi:hypothetical protein
MARSARVLAFLDNIWAGLVGSILGALAASVWAYAKDLPWHTVVVLGAVSFITLTIIIDRTRDVLSRFQPLGDRIQAWILETGNMLGVEHPPETEFMFRITTREDRRFIIVLPAGAKEVVVQAAIVFPPADTNIQGLAALDEEKRKDFLWSLRMSLIQMGVSYRGIEWPLDTITLFTHVRTESLSRQHLVDGIERLHRALHFAMAAVNRHAPAPARAPGP